MALNTWWEGDPDQRYWMEVATTGSMGDVLVAPRFSEASWSYELVSQVRQGDRILHWQSEGGLRGLVGWSVATGGPEITPSYAWQPRGTSGRALSGPRTTEGWVVALGGLNRFDPPLTAHELQEVRQQVLAVNASLERAHRKPTYFPFYLYGGRELRAQQGYLVKFPVELFDVLPSIGAARIRAPAVGPEDLREDNERPRQRVPRGRVTHVQDPLLRSTLENHAVERAIEYYDGLGATNFLKLGKPYDIRLSLAGVVRHVEVKGSSLLIETVELTINEVVHARDYQPTDLVVVDGIDWTRTGDRIITTGGRLRVWPDWTPADGDLSVRRFAYALPLQ
jgi:hypothetical protein